MTGLNYNRFWNQLQQNYINYLNNLECRKKPNSISLVYFLKNKNKKSEVYVNKSKMSCPFHETLTNTRSTSRLLVVNVEFSQGGGGLVVNCDYIHGLLWQLIALGVIVMLSQNGWKFCIYCIVFHNLYTFSFGWGFKQSQKSGDQMSGFQNNFLD